MEVIPQLELLVWIAILLKMYPLSNQDGATKNYVDKNAFTTTCGFVSDDIVVRAGSNPSVSLGCYDLGRGKMLILLQVLSSWLTLALYVVLVRI